jgi:2-polyprenyl-3-methyl-5-hydroxy-6-metoxy-1,4-benzoquinol methylase
MVVEPTRPQDRKRHWDSVYLETDSRALSWHETEFTISLELLKVLDIPTGAAIIDIGAGESNFVDHLIAVDFSDITVLDISEAALDISRKRVGLNRGVTWICEDLLSWKPDRRYDVWHDRAGLHFLGGAEVEVYRELLGQSLTPHGAVILATFALDGPEYCSGLPVTRYGVTELADVLGRDFEVVESRSERHATPTGTIQPFTWIAARQKK